MKQWWKTLDSEFGDKSYSNLIILGIEKNLFYIEGVMSFHPRSMSFLIIILSRQTITTFKSMYLGPIYYTS
jgi:hypothetical protein